jgi:hypothetical membrane protein
MTSPQPQPLVRPPMKGRAVAAHSKRPLSRQLQARIMGVINVPMRVVLGLPFATPLAGRLMLVSLIGRKTGKHYRQPLSYVQEGDVLLTPGGGKWKLNLREGEPVPIRLRGLNVLARPELVSDQDEIERLLVVMTAANPSVRSFVGIPKGANGRLDSIRLQAAIQYGFRIVRWHLAGPLPTPVGDSLQASPNASYKPGVYPRKGPARPNQVTLWLALCGVVGPLAYVLTFTVAGLLRPGYSPVHQTISDLGVGSNFWLLDGASVLNGLLLTVFVAAFFQGTRNVLTERWRWLCSALLMLSPFGFAVAGVFTEDPSTLIVHATLGAGLGLFGPVVAFAVTGLLVRRDSRWRRWGTTLLVAGLMTLVLDGILGYVFTPGTPLAGARLGGLMERAAVIEILAWYVAFALWLLWAGSPATSAAQGVGRVVRHE